MSDDPFAETPFHDSPSQEKGVPSRFIVAIMKEIKAELAPITRQMERVELRLAEGNTQFALHDQRLTVVENRCVHHGTALEQRSERDQDASTRILRKPKFTWWQAAAAGALITYIVPILFQKTVDTLATPRPAPLAQVQVHTP